MRKLRIVFLGTPEFAVASLKALYKSDHTIVGVITAPDRSAGRGRKLQQSAVKQYALKKGLPVLQPTNLKGKAFLARLRSLKANLQVVVAFRMLPKFVWNMPKYGTFNLHASLLPNYRGAAPINWAIINGERQTGVTTFFIDEKIDTGEILLQQEAEIGEHETAGELHDKLMELGAQLIIRTVDRIASGNTTAKKQIVNGEIKSAHKIYKETCEIDWQKPMDEIYDHIRGLSPYPTAWTHLIDRDKKLFLKIYRAAKETDSHPYETGTVLVTKKELKVAVKGGYIILAEVQLPGKKRMSTSDLLNGIALPKDPYVR